MPTTTLNATGRDNLECEFVAQYECASDGRRKTWSYLIFSQDEAPEFFEARFRTLNPTTIRIATIDRNGVEEFKAKGIPEAIFEHVVRISGCTLVSSVALGGTSATAPDFDPDGAEFRSDDAEKMWKRLVKANRAFYDAFTGRYVYVPQAKSIPRTTT